MSNTGLVVITGSILLLVYFLGPMFPTLVGVVVTGIGLKVAWNYA